VKSSLSDPVDYENFIFKLQSEIKQDPLNDLLLFPLDDIIVSAWFVIYHLVFAYLPLSIDAKTLHS